MSEEPKPEADSPNQNSDAAAQPPQNPENPSIPENPQTNEEEPAIASKEEQKEEDFRKSKNRKNKC